MADVVEERSHDQRVGSACSFGEGGALARVLDLGDVFAVALTAEALVDGDDVIDGGERAQTGLPSKSLMSDTRTRSPSALAAAKAASFST